MANVGDTFRVGTRSVQTGRYQHTVCTNTAIFNRGDIFAPCQLTTCPNKGANWRLIQKLT